METNYKAENLKGRYVDLSNGVSNIKEGPVVNFPFESFYFFGGAMEKGDVSMRVPFSTRFQITGHSSKSHLIWPVIMVLLPVILIFLLSLYYSNYYLIFCLLSLPIYFFVFFPNSGNLMSPILFLLVCLGLVFGIWQNYQWIIGFSSIGIIVHLTMKIFHGFVIHISTNTLINDENMFCIVWNNEEIILDMKNGKTFFSVSPNKL